MGEITRYIDPSVVGWITFIFVVGLTVIGALIAVLMKNIVYNVFGLATCLIGVAGLFIFLGSEFLAMMEILIYVGAICIAIVFAIMLSQPMQISIPPRARPKVIFSLGLATVLFVALSIIVTRTPWEAALVQSNDWSVKRLGHMLLTNYELMFELISLVLLLAIVGSIITAAAVGSGGRHREESAEGEEGDA